jgi:hypothetical protein
METLTAGRRKVEKTALCLPLTISFSTTLYHLWGPRSPLTPRLHPERNVKIPSTRRGEILLWKAGQSHMLMFKPEVKNGQCQVASSLRFGQLPTLAD